MVDGHHSAGLVRECAYMILILQAMLLDVSLSICTGALFVSYIGYAA